MMKDILVVKMTVKYLMKEIQETLKKLIMLILIVKLRVNGTITTHLGSVGQVKNLLSC